MAQKGKPFSKKPMGPRTPSTGVKKPMPKPIPKKPMAPRTPLTPKPMPKKKVLVMPDKISPSKMTPAQKARYLKNPERYDG